MCELERDFSQSATRSSARTQPVAAFSPFHPPNLPAAGRRGGKLFTGDHAGGESSALTTSIAGGGGGGESSVDSEGAGAASADAEFSASLIAQLELRKEESSQRERTL